MVKRRHFNREMRLFFCIFVYSRSPLQPAFQPNQQTMPSWYLGKIRYQQPIDEMAIGTRNESLIKQKTVTEAYLIDAVSYTDAEARLYGIVADNTPDFQITGLSPMRLSDVFHLETGEKWYQMQSRLYYRRRTQRQREKGGKRDAYQRRNGEGSLRTHPGEPENNASCRSILPT